MVDSIYLLIFNSFQSEFNEIPAILTIGKHKFIRNFVLLFINAQIMITLRIQITCKHSTIFRFRSSKCKRTNSTKSITYYILLFDHFQNSIPFTVQFRAPVNCLEIQRKSNFAFNHASGVIIYTGDQIQ